jgi:hypothetical protein
MVVEGIVLILRREGALPVRTIQDKLWNLRICISTEEVLGAIQCAQARGLFASYSAPTKGNHAIRMHYYLLDKQEGATWQPALSATMASD